MKKIVILKNYLRNKAIKIKKYFSKFFKMKYYAITYLIFIISMINESKPEMNSLITGITFKELKTIIKKLSY